VSVGTLGCVCMLRCGGIDSRVFIISFYIVTRQHSLLPLSFSMSAVCCNFHCIYVYQSLLVSVTQ
jgi:hypothetical protein